jgi:hypothetical protein
MAASLKFRVFWDILPCTALMMEAARTSETSVDIDLTIQQYISEDSELHIISYMNISDKQISE